MTIIEECREQETDKVSYDLRGMRIAHSVKGIYIKEGKKVLER